MKNDFPQAKQNAFPTLFMLLDIEFFSSLLFGFFRLLAHERKEIGES